MTKWTKHTTLRARELRRQETSFEKTLWRQLRAGRILGIKFRRQHPVGEYYLDFACVLLRLGIELDGSGHVAEDDALRDRWLGQRGWEILRFKNEEVAFSLHAVLETIVSAVRRRAKAIEALMIPTTPLPTLSLTRERETIIEPSG
jgi:very-short-patch-repair endonuclease